MLRELGYRYKVGFVALLSFLLLGIVAPASADEGVRSEMSEEGIGISLSKSFAEPPSRPNSGTRTDISSREEGQRRGSVASPRTSIFNVLVEAPAYGGYTCTDGNCRASQNACVVGADYSTASGDFVATPGRGPASAGANQATRESVTVNTATGERTSNGFQCVTTGPAAAVPASGGGSLPEQEEVVITVTQRDFASMPVAALEPTAGPPDGWLPVNMVNVLHTDSEAQTLTTELLDTPVEVRAIPIEYHWDLGDGTTITTTSPGKPYPSEEITATYRYEGWYDITLTTTFTGQFRVDGGEWEDIDGTIEVTSDPVEIYSKSLASRLTDPYSDASDGTPSGDTDEPWIPERGPDTEGPIDPDAGHHDLT